MEASVGGDSESDRRFGVLPHIGYFMGLWSLFIFTQVTKPEYPECCLINLCNAPSLLRIMSNRLCAHV